MALIVNETDLTKYSHIMHKTVELIIAVIGLFILTSLEASSQDYIYTFDSAPIKSKVVEIGDDYIYYRTWDNPDGPLYNISPSKVTKIAFENGTVKHFASMSPYAGIRPYHTYPLDYRWGSYYGPYGRISPRELSDFIGYSLYGSEYMKARNRLGWGYALTAAGISGLLMSFTTHMVLLESDRAGSMMGFDDMMPARLGSDAGIAVGYIVSAGCLGAGIPLWVKGSRGLRKIADDYNKNHINPPHHSPNLSLGSTRNGIGLAFNF